MSSFFDEDGVVDHEPNGSHLANIQHASVGIARAPEGGGIVEMMVQASQGTVRDQKTMIERAKQIGGLLGGDGFYSFPTGGSTVSGPSIDMAEALAQEWSSMLYKVSIVDSVELASGGRRIHLRASVADLKSLVCAEVDQVVATSAPPGKFAKSGEQSERWHAMQTQSASSKIVRNAILRVLPSWFVEPAFQAAQATHGKNALKGKTLPEARKGTIDGFQQALSITAEELEAYVGQPVDLWAIPQIAVLRALYKALSTGEQSVEAFRAAIAEKLPANSAPRKSALGLPAATENKPLDLSLQTQAGGKEKVEAKKAADKPSREPGSEG